MTCARCHRGLSEEEAHYRTFVDMVEVWYCPACFGLIVRSQPS